jgi:flavodoxin
MPRALVAYYSRTGNTKKLAVKIAKSSRRKASPWL